MKTFAGIAKIDCLSVDRWKNSCATQLFSEMGNSSLSTIISKLPLNDPSFISCNLAHSDLKVAQIQAFQTALSANHTLRELFLEGNNLDDDALILHLVKPICNHSTLQELYLWENRIGDRGVRSLSEGLLANINITTLHLSSNSIGDEGAIALASLIASNSKLSKLYLGRNRIRELGGRAIAKSLTKNSNLRYLDLSSNPLSSLNGSHFILALKANGTLTTLVLTTTGISSNDQQTITTLLKPENRALRTKKINSSSSLSSSNTSFIIPDNIVSNDTKNPASAAMASGELTKTDNQSDAPFQKLAEEVQITETTRQMEVPFKELPLQFSDLSSTTSLSHLSIPIQNLMIQPFPFAKGADGEVYHADYLGVSVAVKKLFHPDEMLQKELEKWCHFRHPNIIQLIGFSQPDNGNPPFIIMELMDRSLFHLLQDKVVDLSWPMRLNIARSIAAGLVYLHVQRQVIHRDIKSLNILVRGHGTEIKLADFGASRGGISLVTKAAGTPRWLAPELYDNHPPTFAVDIYALGITMNELLTRKIPFIELGDNDMAIMKQVTSNQRPQMDPHSPEDITLIVFDSFVQLIQQCWHQDPLQRPSATFVLDSLTTMIKPIPSESTISTSSEMAPSLSSISYGIYETSDFTYSSPPY